MISCHYHVYGVTTYLTVLSQHTLLRRTAFRIVQVWYLYSMMADDTEPDIRYCLLFWNMILWISTRNWEYTNAPPQNQAITFFHRDSLDIGYECM